jgi:hypothetical protein
VEERYNSTLSMGLPEESRLYQGEEIGVAQSFVVNTIKTRSIRKSVVIN